MSNIYIIGLYPIKFTMMGSANKNQLGPKIEPKIFENSGLQVILAPVMI